jgi:hypothetical protein
LPENLQRCMSRPEGEPPARTSGVERMRWLSRAANDIAASLLETEPAKAQARIQVIGERYAKALGVAAKDVQQAVDRSRERLQQTARALDISLGGASPARRLMREPTGDALSAADAQGHGASYAPTAPLALDDAPPAELPPGSIVQSASAQRLSAGIQAITDSMAGDKFRLNDVLRMVLETMHEALAFRVVVFSLRDPKTDTLTGRYAIGESADAVKAAFRVPLRTPAGREPDLFTSLCLKGLDSVIADATTPTITARLPPWFRDSVGAPAFLVLPLMVKGAPFAMIYADKRTPGAMRFTPQELAQLGTLRNQVLMAFRQGAA